MAARTDADAAVDARLIGGSASFQEVIAKIARFGACDAPVLIEGETGTGKELVARALHYRSARGGHPFVPINCAALPEQLVVSELFGYERGAFTGAQGRRLGLVEQARRGTIFFDEVDSLPPAAQAVLLRFLQDQEYRPLGGGLLHADTRVVAASNVCMVREVREHRFREDLYHRLNVLTLGLPPLRARGRDTLELAVHFLDLLSRQYRRAPKALSAAAVSALMRHDWPGNVRELENRLHRSFLMADGREISPVDLGLADVEEDQGPGADAPQPENTFAAAKARAVAAFERAYLCDLMASTEGNVSAASRLAGKERRTFARLLKKHGIDRRGFVSESG